MKINSSLVLDKITGELIGEVDLGTSQWTLQLWIRLMREQIIPWYFLLKVV